MTTVDGTQLQLYMNLSFFHLLFTACCSKSIKLFMIATQRNHVKT